MLLVGVGEDDTVVLGGKVGLDPLPVLGAKGVNVLTSARGTGARKRKRKRERERGIWEIR